MESVETMKKRRFSVRVFTVRPLVLANGSQLWVLGSIFDGMNEIRTVGIIWCKILDCNLIMGKLVDVVPTKYRKCQTLGTTWESVRNKNGKKRKPLR